MIKKYLTKLLLISVMLLCSNTPGFCTQLPENLTSYIKEKFPEAAIRFDGLIELSDGTDYLPVLPLIKQKNIETLEIVKTIPSDKDFSQKPDMVLFNNNFAFLKIIKKEGERPTVISDREMPLNVKLGIFPQDLVVPKGLILPNELKVLLGDLKIPLKIEQDKEGEIAFYGNAEVTKKKNEQIIGKTTEYVSEIPELSFLADKKVYVSNYKENQLNIIDTITGRMESGIKLPSMPFIAILSPDKRYIFMTSPALGKVFVVDTFENKYVKDLKVGKLPRSVVCSKDGKTTYVANGLSSTITEIATKDMSITRNIKVNGSPDNIAVSESKKHIFYNDARTGDLFQLSLNTAASKWLYNVKNISKIEQLGQKLYVLSRTENTLSVFDIKEQKLVKVIKTGNKPIDFQILKEQKVIILCAGSDELNIVDTESLEVSKSVTLNSKGFPGKIELVEDENKALITNHDAYEMIIYNVITEEVESTLPLGKTVSSIVITEK